MGIASMALVHSTPRWPWPRSATATGGAPQSRRCSSPRPATKPCTPTRRAVFLRAADLLSGPWRDRLNAATMLGQSKTVHQAEIDSACELIDFWRWNVHFGERIQEEQPVSSPGQWNRMEYRPLEGFVVAITP